MENERGVINAFELRFFVDFRISNVFDFFRYCGNNVHL